MDIAFLGLGGMGSGMARSLMKHGHKVTAWNRSSEPAEAIHEQGAQVAATPAEAARHAEIAITMLADDRAVESVVLGESALAEGLPKDAVHVSMSTISVALSERLDLAHAERGQQFVAAPVFGRPDQAEGGKLFIAAAGSGDAVKRICPALDAMGQRTFVIGETPAQANLLKLTGNFLITCVIESLAEAFALTTKGGIETSKVYELLTETLFAGLQDLRRHDPRRQVFSPWLQDSSRSEGQPPDPACGREARGGPALRRNCAGPVSGRARPRRWRPRLVGHCEARR